MTPEEKNVDIWAAFSNDDYLPQEPEQKQALGKYSLVQPRGKELSQDKAALVDAYSKYAYPEDCGEDWQAEHIEGKLIQGPNPLADAEDAIKTAQ